MFCVYQSNQIVVSALYEALAASLCSTPNFYRSFLLLREPLSLKAIRAMRNVFSPSSLPVCFLGFLVVANKEGCDALNKQEVRADAVTDLRESDVLEFKRLLDEWRKRRGPEPERCRLDALGNRTFF